MSIKTTIYQSKTFLPNVFHLLIIEPPKINHQTPVLFFYDGHVLQTGKRNFNTANGIKINKLVPHAIIISLSTIDDDETDKWNARIKRLTEYRNQKYHWNLIVEEIVKKYQKQYQGHWYGFGFSLSGLLVLENQHLFDQVISISPAFKNLLYSTNRQGIIFYGTNEYENQNDSNKQVNQPIEQFLKANPQVKSYQINPMKHDFWSWSKHFPKILAQGLPFWRQGWLNHVEQKDQQYIRTAGLEKPQWQNEVAIYQALKIPCQYKNNKLIRPWLPGEIIKKWSPTILAQVKAKIEKLHRLKIPNLTPNDWNKYNQYAKHLKKECFTKYQKLLKRFDQAKLVVSHNDLNKENMLYHHGEVTFIDYEWANLNHPYFDYVQFFIREGVRIDHLDNQEFWDFTYICLIYFILWTYAMPEGAQVLKWRAKHFKQLKIYFKCDCQNK